MAPVEPAPTVVGYESRLAGGDRERRQQFLPARGGYVDVLETAGCITTGLKPVVDQVRTRGNLANHDLPASSEQASLMTLTITRHLLEAMYELPGLAVSAASQPPAASISGASQATVT